MGRDRTAKQWLEILWSRIGSPLRGIDSKHNMNPIGYYLSNDKSLQSLFKKTIEYSSTINNSDIRSAILNFATNGNSLEKIQAITLVAAIKKFNLK